MPDREVYSIPPFANGDIILELLARMPDTCTALSKAEWENVLNQLGKKSSLNFILTEFTEEIDRLMIDLITQDNRKVTLYLPVTPENERLSNYPVIPIKYYDAKTML
jgi:hypothetical protein